MCGSPPYHTVRILGTTSVLLKLQDQGRGQKGYRGLYRDVLQQQEAALIPGQHQPKAVRGTVANGKSGLTVCPFLLDHVMTVSGPIKKLGLPLGEVFRLFLSGLEKTRMVSLVNFKHLPANWKWYLQKS